MTEKQRHLLKEFLMELPKNYQKMFESLSEYLISLGYTPKKTKTKDFILDFSKSKIKRTIAKMEVEDNSLKNSTPGLRLKFYANDHYSDIFKEGIQRVIEEYDGRYTGCYGCGRCKGKLEGYTYTYPDGKQVFRCGNELISIYNFSEKDIDEIKTLIKNQDEFFIKSN